MRGHVTVSFLTYLGKGFESPRFAECSKSKEITTLTELIYFGCILLPHFTRQDPYFVAGPRVPKFGQHFRLRGNIPKYKR
jgi:hypothetical protein